MTEFSRFALYYAPPPGPLADFAARWLGWDAAAGVRMAPPRIEGLPSPAHEITATPRKYGFHGTLKPPFRLAEGRTAAELHSTIGALAKTLAPVTLDQMALARLGGFVAVTPRGDTTALADLAATLVSNLDDFRAPLSPAELQRRRASRLTERQEHLLESWGYPFVMEEFRFHLTLSGNLSPDQAEQLCSALAPHITPHLPQPFVINDLCLFGEATDGMFHILHRYTLTG